LPQAWGVAYVVVNRAIGKNWPPAIDRDEGHAKQLLDRIAAMPVKPGQRGYPVHE